METINHIAIDALVAADVSGGHKVLSYAVDVVERVRDYFEDDCFGDYPEDDLLELADLSIPVPTAAVTGIFADSIDLVYWEPDLPETSVYALRLANQMNIVLYELAVVIAHYAYNELAESYDKEKL